MVQLLFMVAFDASYLVSYITRFTEESFAALVSAIFMYEAIKKLLHIAQERPIHLKPSVYPDNAHMCECSYDNDTYGFTSNFTRKDCKFFNGTLIGEGCSTPAYVPDAFLLSICLFFGTFILARILKDSRNSPYGPSKLRQLLSDFSVLIAIAVFVGIDYLLGISTPKLEVPTEFKVKIEMEKQYGTLIY